MTFCRNKRIMRSIDWGASVRAFRAEAKNKLFLWSRGWKKSLKKKIKDTLSYFSKSIKIKIRIQIFSIQFQTKLSRKAISKKSWTEAKRSAKTIAKLWQTTWALFYWKWQKYKKRMTKIWRNQEKLQKGSLRNMKSPLMKTNCLYWTKRLGIFKE